MGEKQTRLVLRACISTSIMIFSLLLVLFHLRNSMH
jgi:hypothetical protein